DEPFVDLFMNALSTELENEEEVRELIHLFPMGNIGVPQGSALSALCANIVLSEFDADLNSRGICTIRYLDDFVILGQTKHAVLKAWDRAKVFLEELGMECHDPRERTGKAAMGKVADGFDFLSFHIQSNEFYPTAKARAGFLHDLENTIRQAQKS